MKKLNKCSNIEAKRLFFHNELPDKPLKAVNFWSMITSISLAKKPNLIYFRNFFILNIAPLNLQAGIIHSHNTTDRRDLRVQGIMDSGPRDSTGAPEMDGAVSLSMSFIVVSYYKFRLMIKTYYTKYYY
jgi:hypothetical protein